MSLYTPVFPSFRDANISSKGPSENTAPTAPAKQQNYVDFLRDVHLFLSTQSDVLSPPSRPNTPLFDHRVQKVRDQVQNVLSAAEGDTSSGKWTRVSQTLKLGCVRGRHWSVFGPDPSVREEDTKWILPDEESEWVEWERRREESRRLKGKTNAAAQQNGIAVSATSDSKSHHTSTARPYNATRELRLRDVSPTTMRTAKEKVKKWQASVVSEVWHDTMRDFSDAAAIRATATKDKTERPQRSRTLDFAVVKPAAKSILGNKGRAGLSHLGVRGGSAPIPSRKAKSSTPSAADMLGAGPRLGVDENAAEHPLKTSSVRDGTPKIADVPETPYLPPSFPAHLETSTPLPDSVMVVRAKPSPILPITASSTPLPLSSVDPLDKSQLIITEPRAANMSSSLPPQSPPIDTVQSGKRTRSPSAALGNDPPVTPPAKRLRGLSRNRPTRPDEVSKRMSPNRGLNAVPCTRDDALDPGPGLAPPDPFNMDTVGMALAAPSTPGKDDEPPTGGDFPKKIPSPTKSVRSYFSAPDSDQDDSPLKGNLLLESPVSPMLSYAQNGSGFLPQVTSTQAGKESPNIGQTNNGLGMGYNSQFNVERHVDRVSELLEKDVDFDGWLRDVRTVEMSQD